MVTVEKALNNNVVIGRDEFEEVVLIGRGVGFNKKTGDTLEIGEADKVYKLEGQQDTSRYQTLLTMADETLFQSTLEAIELIDDMTSEKLNNRILLSLTDHLLFAMKRMEEGIEMANPFVNETKALYPKEYKIAEAVVDMFNRKYGIHLPEAEVGFIALHVHSSIYNRSLRDMNVLSEVVHQAITMIEYGLDTKVDQSSIQYDRFVRHISFCVQRVMNGESVPTQEQFDSLLKVQYPVCYNIAVKIVKMIQNKLQRKVYDSEVVYLTMHIQHFEHYSK
ncbi:glucose PTS transporter transcription antiterminator GlcT [Salinicoccus halodurans]|uniref:Transcriptional antiterminator, BglG family n=1 Tax=Salinicoccus halodurans TaxID=407035 RepID=A0AA94HGB0_9STAP|nr:transcription antiterminator [Salinicoccus halodurans]SFK69014.1 transcriptional antiterminator, BglG family [Salinicoccus halodurans]